MTEARGASLRASPGALLGSAGLSVPENAARGGGRKRRIPMELGVMFPGQGWGMDGAEARDFAQGVEGIGFDWMGTNDHVTYAYEQAGRERPLYAAPVDQHEPLTLLAHLAAVTERLVLQSAALVLPQRQPTLVAKQAAELDVLSGGRFRLGVGMGWSAAEYESLGVAFEERAARFEEGVAVLRACWGPEPVHFIGRFTVIRAMNMEPKPLTPGGPPIIVGGFVEAAERRAARIGDGWIGISMEGVGGSKPVVERLRAGLAAEGRSGEPFPVQWMVELTDDAAAMTDALRAHREAGVESVLLMLGDGGVAWETGRVDGQLRRLERFWREVRPEIVG